MSPASRTLPRRAAQLYPFIRPDQSRFDRSRLPDPADYFMAELGKLFGRGDWRSAICPFHNDRNPSLSVNVCAGCYRCHSCGAKGGDIIQFQRDRYAQSFTEAARALGAWIERP